MEQNVWKAIEPQVQILRYALIDSVGFIINGRL